MKVYPTTDIASLKLHVDRDVVWTLEGDSLPTSSSQSVSDFVASDFVKDMECVRIMGTHANAKLIVGLYARKLKEEIGRLEVVTPLVCKTQSERSDPELILYRMRNFALAPSLGGFHEITSVDYPAYALAAEFFSQGSTEPVELTDLMRNYLQAHPAWKSLRFIRYLNEFSCARLLAIILDPRWYIDKCNPDRIAKLEAWLGLNPKTQAGILQTIAPLGRHHDKCSTVFNCWYREELKLEVFDNIMEFDLIPWDEDNNACPPGMAPCDFVWRVWASHAENSTIAALRASQMFVRFLRHTWLSAIYEDSMTAGALPLFRSKDFFKYVVEAASFEHYMAN